ncbi:MAG: TIGR02452 family protein [Chloroflexi bacterium]|nr:MAG: TIGR02452 family protein [Chloroflexota bacterium]
MNTDRQELVQIAQETLTILSRGVYCLPGVGAVSIQDTLSTACAHTQLHHPTEYNALVAQLPGLSPSTFTGINVSNRTTLAAGLELAQQFPSLACLNFASAKRPGGGFLNGSSAQEESLARASGLYATLQTQPEFYAYHRQLGTSLYSSHVIFSPSVPVFREDRGQLLAQPWQSSFLTAAAVNAGSMRGRGRGRHDKVGAAMEERIRMVLAVAAYHHCNALVLGAWGCGVFRNDPNQIAHLFAKVLADPLFENRFSHIEFAIYDPSSSLAIITPFQKEFA